MIPPKPRTYRCWVKGERRETEEFITLTEGEGRLLALVRYAHRRGLKSIQCDCIWDKTL